MSEIIPEAVPTSLGPPPPVTGHPGIDEALAGVAGLDAVDLAEHPVRLAEVHTVLRTVLEDRAESWPGPTDAA